MRTINSKGQPVKNLGERIVILAAAFTLLTVAAIHVTAGDWPQWGGANRDFKSDSKGLANAWPEGGPRELWSRPLGEGYSSMAVEGNRLYTMYRKPGTDQETAIALETATGKTLWEFSLDDSELPRMQLEYGPGPHSTPLIAGRRVFVVGSTGKFHALDKQTGKSLWSHDLYKEFGANWRRGYSCSPLAYKDTVILTLGAGGESGVAAFNQQTGELVWKAPDLVYGFSSPILINVDGQDQLVVFMSKAATGLDPSTGKRLWSHPHKTSWGLNISTPVWGPGNLLFLSSAYNGGSRMLQLSQQNGKTVVQQRWFNNRFRIHFGNAIRLGDYIYGSSGDFGPAFFTAVNVRTGKVAWRSRNFSRFSSVYADGKMFLVDEDGDVALVSVSPEGLKVHSRVSVLKNNAWTAPTLAGSTLYVRDRKTLHAFALK